MPLFVCSSCGRTFEAKKKAKRLAEGGLPKSDSVPSPGAARILQASGGGSSDAGPPPPPLLAMTFAPADPDVAMEEQPTLAQRTVAGEESKQVSVATVYSGSIVCKLTETSFHSSNL